MRWLRRRDSAPRLPDLFVTLSATKSCANFANMSGPRRRRSTPLSARACSRYLAALRRASRERALRRQDSPSCARTAAPCRSAQARAQPVAMMEFGPVAGMIGAGASGAPSRHRARDRLRHGRHHRQDRLIADGAPADRGRLCHRRRVQRPADAACRSSISSRSAPAAARSPGATTRGGLHVGPQ